MTATLSPATNNPNITAEPLFIGAACNSFSQCLAWAQGSDKGRPQEEGQQQEQQQQIVVAYGAYNWVALATADGEVKHSLRGHQDKVQCVAWLLPRSVLVSGAADGTVRVWKKQICENGTGEKWAWVHTLRPCAEGAPSPPSSSSEEQTQTDTYKPVNAPVSRLAVLGGRFIVATTSQSITIWQQQHNEKEEENNTWKVIFATSMHPVQIPTSVALVPLNQQHQQHQQQEQEQDLDLALLVGTVDAKIHVWSGTITNNNNINNASTHEWKRVGALLGHQGWVRSLDWRPGQNGSGVLVASGSQDGKIRLWKVEAMEGAAMAAVAGGGGASNGISSSLGEGGNEEEEEEEVGMTDEEDDHEIRLVIGGDVTVVGQGKRRYGVRLDALLVGHEDWVTGLSWHPLITTTNKHTHAHGQDETHYQPLSLLSCSMDRSLIIWRPEGAKGVWTPRVRLGDLGADLGGAVGSNLLGFLGCVFSEDGGRVLGHGFGGSFHAYAREKEREAEEEEDDDDEGIWRPVSFATGHFEEVSDLQWEKAAQAGGGRYLVSVSKDQTTRLWAPASASPTSRYHEMSRVQVHGYDLTCVDLLPGDLLEHRLVSGADEKTLRVFDAPNKVLGLLEALSGIHSSQPARVETAYTPALALSNKAVALSNTTPTPTSNPPAAAASAGDDNDPTTTKTNQPTDTDKTTDNKPGPGDGSEDAEAIAKARARVSWENRGPPLEGELVDHTLWPEVAKLYGHGNGLTCLVCDPTGVYVASACKARDAETACVRVWETGTWRGCGVLGGHSSTVVQLGFSHDGEVLVSVSKDRQVCVYGKRKEEEEEREGEGENENNKKVKRSPFKPVQTLAKAHKRIIWSCDWSHDDALLATGSRDGTVKLWRRKDKRNAEQGEVQEGEGEMGWKTKKQAAAAASAVLLPEALATLKPTCSDSVTAVAFAPRPTHTLTHTHTGDIDTKKEEEEEEYLLAVGLESGDVELWAGTAQAASTWRCLLTFTDSLPHAATVKRLRWKPLTQEQEGKKEELQLASCGADHAVKIVKIRGV